MKFEFSGLFQVIGNKMLVPLIKKFRVCPTASAKHVTCSLGQMVNYNIQFKRWNSYFFGLSVHFHFSLVNYYEYTLVENVIAILPVGVLMYPLWFWL